MSKKTPVNKTKKSRRRLKRSVRRSLAAVLMITAIIIAAIPVPENYATDGTSGDIPNNMADVESIPYSYSVDATQDGTVSQPAITNGTSKTKYTSYSIVEGDRYPVKIWQFQYFTAQVSTGSARNNVNIISNYNKQYLQQTIYINEIIVTQYKEVKKTTYETFYTTNDEKEYKLVMNMENSVDKDNAEKFLQKYFPTQYQEYLKECNSYKDGDLPSLSRRVRDLTDDQKLEYYCDETSGLSGCKLVGVLDDSDVTASGSGVGSGSGNNDPNASGTADLYIPKKITVQENDPETDENGYLVEEITQIRGIGDGVFKGVGNVTSLVTSEKIPLNYIGVSAFEDSYIQNIDLRNIEYISDCAFKGCHNLINIDLSQNTKEIGTEAFYDTGLREVKLASEVRLIGPGAFAKCTNLQSVDFSNVKVSLNIRKYAFYNATALSKVNFGVTESMEEFNKPTANATVDIVSLGEGAFAVEDPETGTMNMFTFPSNLSVPISANNANGLGDYVLAGRAGLRYVTMPASFGRNSNVTVPVNTFYYCFNLACVKFPDNSVGSCGYATYNSKETDTSRLFGTVTNKDFYVKGPKMTLPGGKDEAEPRKATWDAITAVSDKVPYLYVDKNKEYYEVSDGTYLLCIDNKGVLTSCTRKDKTSSGIVDELVIPSKVGNVDVTAIEKGCFSDVELNKKVRTLTIEDNSVAKIDDEVFKGWEILEKVYIGNSVKSIGKEAFKDCNQLVDVTFSSPEDHASFTIGTDAFKTGSSRLTFHGDIVEGYAPFEWATDKNNVITSDPLLGDLRVCYQSLFPTYLTVMYNPNTDMVTLLDYPKTSQVSKLLNERYAEQIANSPGTSYGSYENMRVQQAYTQYADAYYDEQRVTFANKWQAADDDPEAIAALYASNDYGPWVNPTFVSEWSKWLNGAPNSEPGGGPDDSTSEHSSLTDILFEPIVAYAASGTPDAYFSHPGNEFDVVKNSSLSFAYIAPSDEEKSLVNATRYINIPVGVDSIDVYGYCYNLLEDGETEGLNSNTNNMNTYLTGRYGIWDAATKAMYTDESAGEDREDSADIISGLFSGSYDDYGLSPAEAEADGSPERHVRGNDRILQVNMGSVKYLPKYAFDSCEQLQLVTIGPACGDIGTAPFRGCYNLVNVNCDGNRKYTAQNGIIYSRDTVTDESDLGSYPGTYTIEECLYARGKNGGVGASTVPEPGYSEGVETNIISRVKTIREGAFEECVNVTFVNLETALNLTDIPMDCFKNCSTLQRIWLPRTVNNIEEGAFENDNFLSELQIPGREVFISARAFKDAKLTGKQTVTTIKTYEDSSAKRYVDKYGDVYLLAYEEIPTEWTVIFLDADGKQVGDTLYKADGSYLQPDEIPAAPEKEGWVFQKWLSTNQTEVSQPITANTVFIAQGFSANGMIDGVHYTVDFYDQVDGSKIGETQLILPGGAAIAPQVPEHKGYTFTKWSSEDYLNVQANLVIFALYSGSGSGGSGSGNTSKGSTNSGNGSSNNGSSSTSGTSTSSGATGKYTVTVVNGSGSGSYDVGTTVVIAANTPAAGKVFNKWTTESTGVTLASVSMSATTFVMPANNVTITANFIDGAPVASGTVGTGTNRNNGTNTGSTRVDITKPGISNKDLATATVNGSTDNFVVKISETDEATQAVINALTNKYGSLESILYYAMDISLYDSTGTTKITNTEGLTVDITIPIPDALTVFGGNNMAGAVINNQQLEELSERFTTINGVPCISFTATHFSPYTIYVNTQNLSEGLLDSTPKTGDPIHPKWFLSIGLASLSIILFMKRDKKAVKVKTA